MLEGAAHLEEIPSLTARAIKPLTAFFGLLAGWVEKRETLGVKDLAELILQESGYLSELRNEGSIESQSRLENLDEFISLTVEFEQNSDDKSLAAFLETVALVADVDNYETEADAVVLMTLHSAKGLEFPVVFLVGLEEGLFPHSRSLLETNELEEERRLCYVGITRARQRLYITHANMRTVYGSTSVAVPSRFLLELPKEIMVNLKGANRPSPAAAAGPSRPGASMGMRPGARLPASGVPNAGHPAGDPAAIRVGTKVRHAKWGIGTVVTKEGVGADAQVKVAFPGLGIKSLILAYANLEPLE